MNSSLSSFFMDSGWSLSNHVGILVKGQLSSSLSWISWPIGHQTERVCPFCQSQSQFKLQLVCVCLYSWFFLHQPGKVSKWANVAKHSKAELIRLMNKHLIIKVINLISSNWSIFITSINIHHNDLIFILMINNIYFDEFS